MSELNPPIKTGQMKAHRKWTDADGAWQIGSVVEACGDSLLMRAYHTGRLMWVRSEQLTDYPERTIPEPEVRT